MRTAIGIWGANLLLALCLTSPAIAAPAPAPRSRVVVAADLADTSCTLTWGGYDYQVWFFADGSCTLLSRWGGWQRGRWSLEAGTLVVIEGTPGDRYPLRWSVELVKLHPHLRTCPPACAGTARMNGQSGVDIKITPRPHSVKHPRR